MLQSLEIFDLAASRARHAAERQRVVAENIANADTPGYRAQDVRDFQDIYAASSRASAAEIDFSQRIDARGPMSPNGNTVSLELEMLRGVEAQRAHSRSITVYQSALNILRTSLGR